MTSFGQVSSFQDATPHTSILLKEIPISDFFFFLVSSFSSPNFESVVTTMPCITFLFSLAFC